MSEPEKQRFIAYGTSADEYCIEFHGGPLDGTQIKTDILPDAERFRHRIRQRGYWYQYTQLECGNFRADFDHFIS